MGAAIVIAPEYKPADAECRSPGAPPQHPGHRPEHGPAVQGEGAGGDGVDGPGGEDYTIILRFAVHLHFPVTIRQLFDVKVFVIYPGQLDSLPLRF